MTATLETGSSFVSVRKLTQEQIDAYAESSHDRNPLHLDLEFARRAGFRNTIGHGMLTLAMLDDLLAGTFGDSWVRAGQLRVQFKTPAYAGDELTSSCTINTVTATGHGRVMTCRVSMTNPDSEEIIGGIAMVTLAHPAAGSASA